MKWFNLYGEYFMKAALAEVGNQDGNKVRFANNAAIIVIT